MSMDELLNILDQGEGIVAYLVLFVSAALEYVFPPFPGDTVTLFGAFLITARGWNVALVLLSVTAGSLLGATIDYYIGVGLARDNGTAPRSWIGRRWHSGRDSLGPLVDRLRSRGASYIIINRFLPGIRAFFFVAAGMAGLSLRAVLIYAAVSALLWNILIISIGAALGASWERLHSLFEAYTTAVWIALVVAFIALLIRWWIRRRKTV